MLINYLLWVVVVGLLTAFLLKLAMKWGVIEWLQVHAPNDFLNRLFSCAFCCSFHLGMAISILIAFEMGEYYILLVPFCSTIVAIKQL